ncbi:MAG: hypothetical protein Q8P18_17720 [Pseudomonadota bacterium]|nr:hypothetical protein [Pseudomonadota bacterium]
MHHILLSSSLLSGCGYSVTPTCVEAESVELEDDEVSLLGFSAADLLTIVVGERTVPGRLENEERVDVRVNVQRGAGPAVFTHMEESSTRRANGQLFGEHRFDLALHCDDDFFVPTTFALTTSDGSLSFDEEAPAYGSPDVVHVGVRIPVMEAEGLPAADNANLDEAYLTSSYSDGGGTLRGGLGWSGTNDTSDIERFAVTWDSTWPADGADE